MLTVISSDSPIPSPPPCPPLACCPLPSHVAVRGNGPRRRGRGSSWSEGGGIKDDDGRHRRQPLSPITVVIGRRSRRRQCRHHHALTLASTVTIAAASFDVTASPNHLSMVGCGFVCRPSPTALSAVRIDQPLPSCDRRRFRHRAAVPFCLPSPATVLSLFY